MKRGDPSPFILDSSLVRNLPNICFRTKTISLIGCIICLKLLCGSFSIDDIFELILQW